MRESLVHFSLIKRNKSLGLIVRLFVFATLFLGIFFATVGNSTTYAQCAEGNGQWRHNECIGCRESQPVNIDFAVCGEPQYDPACDGPSYCPSECDTIFLYNECADCNTSRSVYQNTCSGEYSTGPNQPDLECGTNNNFEWCPDAGGAGAGGSPEDQTPKPPDGCQGYAAQTSPDGRTYYTCNRVNTAIGAVDVGTPQGFIRNLFSILLGLAGFLAIALIVYSGYLYLSSTGDKQKVQQAREVLTASIVGLLFIIFSAVILEIIGVNILGIFAPGA